MAKDINLWKVSWTLFDISDSMEMSSTFNSGMIDDETVVREFVGRKISKPYSNLTIEKIENIK